MTLHAVKPGHWLKANQNHWFWGALTITISKYLKLSSQTTSVYLLPKNSGSSDGTENMQMGQN